MRAEYARRRGALVESLGTHAPQLRLTGLAAGFHAVGHLPDGADERHVIDEARRRRVGLRGMSIYRSGREATPPQLVFGFGNTGTREIEAGIAAVADLLR